MSTTPRSQPPVIIYQMGKVGSTSLYKSVQASLPAVYQVHSLAPNRIEKSARILKNAGLGLPLHLRQSTYVLQQYLQSGVPVKCITPIRSPLRRNISAFFQDLSTEVVLKPDLRRLLGASNVIGWLARLPLPNEWKNALIQRWIQPLTDRHIDALMAYFLSNFLHRFPLDWFDFELKEALHIDVYDEAFDATKGYRRYQKGTIDLLVLKSELRNEDKTHIVREFLGKEIPMIQSDHVSADKTYGRTMREFQSRLHVDKAIMQEFNESKFVRQFYPEGIF